MVANAVSSHLFIPFDGLEKTEATFTFFFSIKNALSGLEGENTYMMVIMQIMSDDMYLKIIGNWSSASHV